MCSSDLYHKRNQKKCYSNYRKVIIHRGRGHKNRVLKVPNEYTTGIVSVFQTKPASYNWQVSDFKIDNPDNMVIYELLFRDFTQVGSELATGTIKEATKHLDYIKSLGVNAIELMPIQEFDGNNSWGYNPCYYFAMDKEIGRAHV